jgi:DNA-binding PadR family transcriptional regulator
VTAGRALREFTGAGNACIDISIRYNVTHVLDLAVLGLLRDGPRHGYELKQRCSDIVGGLWGISFGSLYPALRRLERDGAIRSVETDDEPAAVVPMPSTGSLSGDLAAARRRRRPRPVRRNRKAYAITDTGVAALHALLVDDDDDSAADDRTFALKLAFCRFLSPEERIALLERRRAHLSARVSRARRGNPARNTDRYTRSLLDYRARSTEHELAWIDELITDERSALRTDRPEGATA